VVDPFSPDTLCFRGPENDDKVGIEKSSTAVGIVGTAKKLEIEPLIVILYSMVRRSTCCEVQREIADSVLPLASQGVSKAEMSKVSAMSITPIHSIATELKFKVTIHNDRR